MNRIGLVWKGICKAAEDEETRLLLEHEQYAFHKLKRMVVFEPKKRVIDFADDGDKKLLTAAHKVLAPLLTRRLSHCTYSSIKGRGIKGCVEKMKRMAKRHGGGHYVQLDIKGYYRSIVHEKLKELLRCLIKDTKTLRFLDAMVNNHKDGVAIGLSLSAYVANLYLDDIDRWLTEQLKLDAVRYMDDIVVFVHDKREGHVVLAELKERLAEKGLTVKDNWRIAPVTQGIRFIGYQFYPTHTLLRKNIRERMKAAHRQLMRRGADDAEYKLKMAGYFGWCMMANSFHLMRKVMGERYKLFEKNIERMQYKRLKDKRAVEWFSLPKETRVSICDLVRRDVVIFESKEVTIAGVTKAAFRFCYPDREEEMHYTITRSDVVMDRLKRDAEDFPAVVTFVEKKAKNGRKYIAYE